MVQICPYGGPAPSCHFFKSAYFEGSIGDGKNTYPISKASEQLHIAFVLFHFIEWLIIPI